MKLLLIASVILALSGQPLNAQAEKKYCYPDSEYRLSLEVDIATLRISLFHISTLVRELGDRSNHEDLAKVAKGAVYSLANEFSQRGDYFQKCSLTQDEYGQISHGSIKFRIGLRSITELDDSILIDHLHWPLSSIPPFRGHMVHNPDIRGHALPYHLVVGRSLLEFFVGRDAMSVTDPIVVAARELLGEKVEWDEKQFVPAPFFKINPQHPLARDGGATDKLGDTWQERLRSMAGYWVTLQK